MQGHPTTCLIWIRGQVKWELSSANLKLYLTKLKLRTKNNLILLDLKIYSGLIKYTSRDDLWKTIHPNNLQSQWITEHFSKF